ncbi:MarR family winged helix-turn-helix transcriptional regulator [Pseudooceanicola aestuarii]|uniref:MarR family winged helix-turn-helix transcriptional regulator n=1 Tax=Pseudooceanicola aestuarii TaxID=2697319 RepID=UPI0013D86C4A|nr:MarR family winged helix-turn-helix transcriptional regulator [Pseudooceanicola aestuarii]
MDHDDFDLLHFLPYLLNQAAEAASLDFQAIYRSRYGIQRAEWRILFHLGLFGQLTAAEIGHRTRMHKTKVSRAVQRLEDRAYLSRERSRSDRRQEVLRLTEAGTEVYTDLRRTAADYDGALRARFTEDEARILMDALGKLAALEGREAP